MMRFMERLDQQMGAKTWVANPAARSASNNPAGSSSQYPREMLSRHPSTSNLHQLRRQPSIDEQRKLKEQRLAELARQLELTHLQNDPPRAKPVASQAPSQPLSPIANLPAEPLYPSRSELEWQERQRKVEEINQRIEFLKSSGFPRDRMPSPVQLPSRSVSQARMDRVHLNSALSHDYHTPAPLSPPIDHGLRHQASKRSLNSRSASHPMKSPPSMNLQKNHTQKSPSSSQVGYYQALKEAEALIGKLRKSHDDLLARAKDLENQLNLKEDENRNLMTRNQRLEAFLADEQSVKEEIQMENERLINQLKSLSFPSQSSNPKSQFPHTQANKSHQETIFDSLPAGSGPLHHNMSSVRAELLKREENLQRHYASYEYSSPPIRPEPLQPGMNLRPQTSPQPAQKSNIPSNNPNHKGGHASGKTSAFRFPTNRDPDPTNEEPRLTNDNNPNHSNVSSITHQRTFGSNGLDDLRRPSQDSPLFHGQFTSQSHTLRSSNDQLPLPPLMNDQLPWSYPLPPAHLRPQPFPAYGFY